MKEKIAQTNNVTLLRQFIQERIRSYREPTREGTPRGENIGFPVAKYGATLYGLTRIKQKEIAEWLGVSHGLLRKWRTEEPFKLMADKHCHDFAELFVRNLRDRITQRETLNDAFIAQSPQDIASQPIPSLRYDEVSDADVYSDELLSCILDAVEKMLIDNGEKELVLIVEVLNMLSAMRFFMGKKTPDSFAEAEKKFANNILKSIVEESIEILLKPNLDEKDRKSLLTIMRMIIQSFE